MKPLQIMIMVLFVFKRYNHVKCIIYQTFADNDSGIIYNKDIKRYSHIKCTTYETGVDNDCGIIFIQEIQPRNMYNI